MKIIILIFLSFMVLHTGAQTIYPSGVSGCIARWTFDDPTGNLTTIQDASGNNNHGTNNSIVSVAGWKGGANKAGKFNGNGSWSQVQHNNILNCPTEITMVTVARLNNFNSAPCNFSQIISKGYPHFIPGNYGFGVGDGPYDNDCNVFSPNNMQFVQQTGSGAFNPPAGNYLQLNTWYFFASTISPTSVINYQVVMDSSNKATNMVPINTSNGSYSIGTNAQNISIGKHLNPQYPYWLDGDIDELVLFNRALSASEILTIYEYNFGYPTAIDEKPSSENYFEVFCSNSEISVNSVLKEYTLEIFDIVGHLIFKKSGCNGLEKVKLSNATKDFLIIKLTDKNKKIFHSAKVLN